MILITERYQIVSQNNHILKGECNRCGACCERLKCEHLKHETLDYVPRAVCSIYNKRPVWCAIWPQIDDDLPHGCGFHWEKM